MRLRNKKTGKIVELDYFSMHYNRPEEWGQQPCSTWNHSLAELNEEWEDEPDEEWRDVLGFEELYQVSNLGNVRTVKRGEATEMAQEEHWNGYLSVHLRNKGVERRASVHRLVAEAFIPNPDGLRDVNHKNGIKTDNRVENLEWLSHSDNIKHMYKMKEPKEPLIKDEKIRKAVRAWAELSGVDKCHFEHNDGSFAGKWYGISLPTSKYGEDIESGFYTIAELCGEEEE